MTKILVFFDNYSHYHLARVTALQNYVKSKNWEVIGMEITRDGIDYQWQNHLNDEIPIISLLGNRKLDEVSFFYLTQQLFNNLKKIDADVLVVAGYHRKVMILATLVFRASGFPVVLMSESKEDDSSRKWLVEKAKKLWLKCYQSAHVGGKSHRDYLIKLGMKPEGIFTGYDVVDNQTFHPDVIKKLPAPFTFPYFLTVNRFLPKKNLFNLIQAYHQYHQQSNNPWHLILCGDGELKQQIIQLITDLKLSDYIHLTGFLQQQELLPYFAHGQCFIHASKQEQWGLVVNEAMGASLPVIVSRCCGCFDDLVREGVNGFGFDPENIKELSDLMMKVSPPHCNLKAMGEASLQHIQNYSPLTFAEGLTSAITFAQNKK